MPPPVPWEVGGARVERAEMAVVLDAGGLIAIDRRERRVGALLRVAQEAAIPVVTSAAAVAQVWRHGSRQAHLGS
jgi:hypothetical protein